MPAPTDTIAALATPAGVSAIAVVRVSGPDTAGVAAAVFGAAPPPRTVRRGRYRDRAGALLDDVLVTFFAGPHSYTGEDALEISSHGNPFIAQKILEDLFARGCRPAQAGEFTQRAFLNGRMDLSQAEAVMDVIHARSDRALAAAHRLLRGALGRRMNGLIERLVGVLARIEAYIDFPEDDLPAEDRSQARRDVGWILLETNRLMATSHYGELLRDGLKTVIIGPPNAGKSSLLNRLVGHERALVSPEPGTTRDFIEERIIIGPHCLRLIDTAGLNPAPGAVEKLGIEKTMERLDDSDLVVVVLDASLPYPSLPPFPPAKPLLCVLNKIDLVGESRPQSPFLDSSVETIEVSARTGAGLERLTAAIVRRADAFQVESGPDAVAINARHAHALAQARECLQAAKAKLEGDAPVELLASDLRGVLDAFGEIVGRIDNEDVLDRLFATFCIGK